MHAYKSQSTFDEKKDRRWEDISCKSTKKKSTPGLLYALNPLESCQALYHGEENPVNAYIQLCLSAQNVRRKKISYFTGESLSTTGTLTNWSASIKTVFSENFLLQ